MIELIKKLFGIDKNRVLSISNIKSKFPRLQKDLDFLEYNRKDIYKLSFLYSELFNEEEYESFLQLKRDFDTVPNLLIHGEEEKYSLFIDFDSGRLYRGDQKEFRSIREYLKDRIDGIYKVGYFTLLEDTDACRSLKKLQKQYKNLFKI